MHFLRRTGEFPFSHFESYYEVYSDSLPLLKECSLQEHSIFHDSDISETAYPVSNLPKNLLPVCSCLHGTGSLPLKESASNLLLGISKTVLPQKALYFFLLSAFYSCSPWYIHFCKDILYNHCTDRCFFH